MFSYKQPDLKTPDSFTLNAREAVIHNLSTSRQQHLPILEQPYANIQQSIIPQRIPSSANHNNNNNSNVLDRVKTGSSILARFGKRTNKHSSPSLPNLSKTTSYASSIHSSSTTSSTASNSVFSSNSSIYSNNSSIDSTLQQHDYTKYHFPTTTPSPSSPSYNNRLVLNLSSVLDEINSDKHAIKNAGSQIFNELNSILRTTKAKNQDSPEKLIDWNLNLMRVLLFIYQNNEPFEWKNKTVYVKVDDIHAKSALTSELTKIQKMNNPKFNSFLSHVQKKEDNNSIKNSISGEYFNETFLLKVEKVEEEHLNQDDNEFVNLLINSELFKEFQIDPNFKKLVATVSISNSKKLNLNNYRMIALRNYFLNLLVAAQTLFEFHYSDLIGVNVSKLESSERKLLWDGIRERNFEKIQIFGWL